MRVTNKEKPMAGGEELFENTTDNGITVRLPNVTKANPTGRKLPPPGSSKFKDIEPGDRMVLPMDRGIKLGLTQVKRIPKQIIEDKEKKDTIVNK